MFDVGSERRVVDRTVEHRRGRQLGGTERRHHRVRLPMAARRVIRDTRAAQTAGVATQQIGGDPRLVNEDVTGRVMERQRLMPLPASGRDIRATLFVGVYRFF